MPAAAVVASQIVSPGANGSSRPGLASPPEPVLSCRAEDALGTARQLFESWMRASLRPGLGSALPYPERTLPRTAILRLVERAPGLGSPSAESRRLVRVLGERLHGLEGIFRHPYGTGGPAPELSALVLEVGLAILSVFAKLEAEQAAQRAATDPLTGLDGRRAMEERLKQERSRTAREGRRCALAILDVDHVKRINDTHRHAVGDRVLVRLACLLQESLRSYDGVYRYGGEEFVLCLPGVDAGIAHRMVERIRRAVTTTPLEASAERTIFVSFSAGIAEIAPDLAPARSLELADAALYRAKAAGRNQVFLSEVPAAD
jgi:diguanylate cyclase